MAEAKRTYTEVSERIIYGSHCPTPDHDSAHEYEDTGVALQQRQLARPTGRRFNFYTHWNTLVSQVQASSVTSYVYKADSFLINGIANNLVSLVQSCLCDFFTCGLVKALCCWR